jgi:hypothetical protein
VPVDDDYVYEKQNRPNQRSKLDEASVSGDGHKVAWAAFTKIETAVKPSDPRNISQGTPASNLKYSRFVYAFHNGVMAEQDWYAFNKTPAECAERVGTILANAPHAVLADGSRFDGHVKRRARILERLCMLRFFQKVYHRRMNEAMDNQIALPGTTAEGRRYFSGYGRGSGSSETSDFNSIDTAFIDYCAWRNTTVGGTKLTPDEAWAALGIYGGDDSLTGAVDPHALKRSSELMGQDYEITVVRRGDIGVEFLNRQFGPDVWTGDVNSMSNPARLLSKLWVGPTRLHKPLERFAERASGYYRMDRNSPVIGDIVTVAHELLGERMEGELMPWDGKHSLESNWPNEDSGWMQDIFDKFIPDFDFDRFKEWINTVRLTQNSALLLQAPLCTSALGTEPVVKKTAVIGEQLVFPAPKQDALPPKDKDEVEFAARSPNPLSQAGVWKFTTDDLFDSSITVDSRPASATVEEADALIPVVGAGGKRATNDRHTAQGRNPSGGPYTTPEGKTSWLSAKDRAIAAETKAALDVKDKKKAFSDPRQWAEPKKWDEESPADFAARLKTWKSKRAAVAKRLNVKLT